MFSSVSRLFAQDVPVTDDPFTDIPTDVTTDIPVNNFTEAEAEAAGGLLAGIGIGMVIFYLILTIFYLVCSIKIFQKAGQAWWKAVIPIYSAYVQIKFVGRPGWWLILLLIPFVNIVVGIVVLHDLSKSFGKDVGTTLLLIFVPFIMYPLMAFGKDYQYVGPAADPNFDPNSGAGSSGIAGGSASSQPFTPASSSQTSGGAAGNTNEVSPSTPSPQPVTPPTVTPPATQVAAAPENPVQVPPAPVQPVGPPRPSAPDMPGSSPQNPEGSQTPPDEDTPQQPPQNPIV